MCSWSIVTPARPVSAGFLEVDWPTVAKSFARSFQARAPGKRAGVKRKRRDNIFTKEREAVQVRT